MAGFGDLAEIIFRKNDCVLLLRRGECCVTDIEKIGA